MKNQSRQRLENTDKIRQEYEQHHKIITKIKEVKTEEEKEEEKQLAHKFQEIKKLEDMMERKWISTKVVDRKTIKQADDNKAEDLYQLNAEWVINQSSNQSII